MARTNPIKATSRHVNQATDMAGKCHVTWWNGGNCRDIVSSASQREGGGGRGANPIFLNQATHYTSQDYKILKTLNLSRGAGFYFNGLFPCLPLKLIGRNINFYFVKGRSKSMGQKNIIVILFVVLKVTINTYTKKVQIVHIQIIYKF